jgi:DNA-binding NarL/FixJ family response regulator
VLRDTGNPLYMQNLELLGAAEALREAVGAFVLPLYSAEYDRGLAAARAELDEEAFRAAWLEGRAMTPEQAIEYALETEEAAPPIPNDTTLLSAREVEVLQLVAQGLTDPQVAERLYLSPRTVGVHLRSIYRKLGVPSRAAAVKEAVERHLI